MASPLDFDQITQRLRRPASRGRSTRLSYPSKVRPFVPQTVIVQRCPDGCEPLSCDIMLFSAPAAVGKSTFARAISAASGVPLLDQGFVLAVLAYGSSDNGFIL